MFNTDGIIKNIKKELTPVLEKGQKNHRLAVVLNGVVSLLSAEMMRGGAVDAQVANQHIKLVLSLVKQIEKSLEGESD